MQLVPFFSTSCVAHMAQSVNKLEIRNNNWEETNLNQFLILYQKLVKNNSSFKLILYYIGPMWMVLSGFTRVFWQVYLDLSIWTCLFWPVSLDRSIETSLFGLGC